MNWVSGLIMFVLIWWVTLFVTLPFGVRSQHETGNVDWGTDPGAPSRSAMGRRLLWTTGLTVVFWCIAFLLVQSGTLRLETLGSLPESAR